MHAEEIIKEVPNNACMKMYNKMLVMMWKEQEKHSNCPTVRDWLGESWSVPIVEQCAAPGNEDLYLPTGLPDCMKPHQILFQHPVPSFLAVIMV